ncbi:MAG: autotransporter domain-containing protein [Helicobacter sp.]|nr:autotransporter domain-containing protein [Helicobacter sp.]
MVGKKAFANTAIKYSVLQSRIKLNDAINKNDVQNQAISINQSLGYNISIADAKDYEDGFKITPNVELAYAYVSGKDLKWQKIINDKIYHIRSSQDSLQIIKPKLNLASSYRLNIDDALISLKGNVGLEYAKFISDIRIKSDKTTDIAKLNRDNFNANVNLALALQMKPFNAHLSLLKSFLGDISKSYELGFGLGIRF